MSSSTLTPSQAHALFDILVHHQLYAEIERFKYPDAIDKYGFPFKKEDGVQTTSPLLQNMVNKFALPLPCLNSIGLEFWRDKCGVLVKKLGEAELSESYDKGAIGARKALATAISAILEYVARGMLGGYPKKKDTDLGRQYDTSHAEDVLQAWEDGVQELIYGDLIDELFEQTAETGKLEDHSSMVQGAHEFILLNIASFLHHVFVMSPDGQYLLRLIENVHRLVPYTLIRQTLRVGNAATMINGMVRLVLTKLSVTAFTNWMGLSNNANDGMNLMQQIISTVMAWDTSEFQKRATKLESTKDGPCKQVFKALRTHVYASRNKHEEVREQSIEQSKSIIAVILETADPPVDVKNITEHHHDVAMEFYSTLLSIRDREELTKILCKLQPDILTSAVRDLVSAYDPMIRSIHNAVDLSDTVTDLENFLTDLIKIAKPKKEKGWSRPSSRANSRSNSPNPNGTHTEHHHENPLPTVEDFVHLVRKHIPSSHKFLHQVAKNAPDLSNQFLDWAKNSISEFRVRDSPHIADSAAPETSKKADPDTKTAAGSMTAILTSLFATLSKDQQEEIMPLLNQHASHLKQLKSTSTSRLKDLISAAHGSASPQPSPPVNKPLPPNTGSNTNQHHKYNNQHGPGIYLARWHALLDSTLITPSTPSGPIRRGWEVKGELDGKGLKTDSLIKKTIRGRGDRTNLSVDIESGTGDRIEQRERQRDGKEELKTDEVWRHMKPLFEGVLVGMEVMGSE